MKLKDIVKVITVVSLFICFCSCNQQYEKTNISEKFKTLIPFFPLQVLPFTWHEKLPESKILPDSLTVLYFNETNGDVLTAIGRLSGEGWNGLLYKAERAPDESKWLMALFNERGDWKGNISIGGSFYNLANKYFQTGLDCKIYTDSLSVTWLAHHGNSGDDIPLYTSFG